MVPVAGLTCCGYGTSQALWTAGHTITGIQLGSLTLPFPKPIVTSGTRLTDWTALRTAIAKLPLYRGVAGEVSAIVAVYYTTGMAGFILGALSSSTPYLIVDGVTTYPVDDRASVSNLLVSSQQTYPAHPALSSLRIGQAVAGLRQQPRAKGVTVK